MNVKFESPYTKCPVCKSPNIQDYHKDFRDINIAICRDCKVQFMNPVYSDSYLDEYYNNYTHSEYSQIIIDEQHFTANDNLQIVEKYLGHTGSMLDYGCGNGEHSNVALKRGWDVVGYDVDCATAENISSKYNFEYLCGSFESLSLADEMFDLVYANQVVEHLKAPVKELGLIHGLIKKDGVFLVAVPNIHSLSRRVKFLLEKIGLRRKNIGKYYDSDHHVFYYDKKSICNLLKVAGFEIIYTYNSKKPKLNQNSISKFFRRNIFEKIIPNSALLVLAKKI